MVAFDRRLWSRTDRRLGSDVRLDRCGPHGTPSGDSGCAAPSHDGNERLARRPVDWRDLDVRMLQQHSFTRELVALSRDSAQLAADGGRNRRRECLLMKPMIALLALFV